MIQSLVKFAITLILLSAIILGLVYYSGVMAGGVGAGAFILGWVNGVGDSIMQI